MNNAGKIAIGVMAGLFAIAAILLVVLLVIRHQRKVLKATQSRTVLVNEPEISETTPPRLPRIEENGDEENAQTLSSSVNRNGAQFQRDNFRNHHSPQREVNQVNMQNLQHNCRSPQGEVNQVNMQDLQHNCHSPQREVNQVNMQDVRHDRTNIMNSAVRFSDISEPTVI